MKDYHFEYALLPDGWAKEVRITMDSHGLIDHVLENADRAQSEFISGYAMPGMPNLHSHAFQRMMAGLTEYTQQAHDNFWSWRDLMYRYANLLAADDLQTIYTFVYMEMLKAGYTSVAEFHYLHHDSDGKPYPDNTEMSMAVLAAATAAGIALTHLPVLYMTAGFDQAPLKKQQQRFYHTPDSYIQLIEKLTPVFNQENNAVLGMAFHSLRAVPADALKTVLSFRQEQTIYTPVHIHIAEQQAEVDASLLILKQRPVEWLINHVELNSSWCLVHATYSNDAEIKALAATGAVVGLCPITEANLGDGVFPLRDFIQAGGQFGIGSDSNVSIDPREELRLLEYSQRLTQQQRNILALNIGEHSGLRLYQQSLSGGGQACGLQTGMLSAGQRADICVFEAEQIHLQSIAPEFVLDSLIFNSNTLPPSTVFIRGKKIIAEGRHHNEEAITAAYRHVIKKLRS